MRVIAHPLHWLPVIYYIKLKIHLSVYILLLMLITQSCVDQSKLDLLKMIAMSSGISKFIFEVSKSYCLLIAKH